MSLPTKSEKFAELIEHLRLGAEASYTIGHLTADEDKLIATGWRAIGQMLEETCIKVTQLATKGRLN